MKNVAKNASIEAISKWLKDEDCDVRNSAMLACLKNGIELPIIRMVEPPEFVYKKCIQNVIVVARIPKTAQVRGTLNGKCRASEAEIIEIIGDVCGEKIGISKHDCKTMYEEGDFVKIEDFDYSEKECSTGFHFFCTRELAENYN